MFGEVPVFPFVIPFGIAVFVALLIGLRSRRTLTLPRATVAATAALYTAGIVANTVFPIYLAWPTTDIPQSLPLNLNLIPIVDYEVTDAATNVLIFVPLGILVSLLLRRPTLLGVVIVGASISLVIEVTQFITASVAHGGHIADINDWLCNSIGSLAGYAIYVLVMRQRTLKRMLTPFHW